MLHINANAHRYYYYKHQPSLFSLVYLHVSCVDRPLWMKVSIVGISFLLLTSATTTSNLNPVASVWQTSLLAFEVMLEG